MFVGLIVCILLVPFILGYPIFTGRAIPLLLSLQTTKLKMLGLCGG